MQHSSKLLRDSVNRCTRLKPSSISGMPQPLAYTVYNLSTVSLASMVIKCLTCVMDAKSRTIGIRVNHALYERLEAMAKADKRTLSQFCNLILAEYIAKLEKDGK